jgi:hypothetical protein
MHPSILFFFKKIKQNNKQDTLFRDSLISHLIIDSQNFRESHKIVNAGVNGFDTLADVGTTCSHDFSKISNAKVSVVIYL